MKAKMKVALVYDRVNKWGGAERVLLALHEIWPEAPLYTAVYNPKTAPWARKFEVVSSFLNKFFFAKRRHETYPYLMPLVFESFDFSDYDVVISITSEAAKGIITRPKTLHVCYCLTPTRYLWSGYENYFQTPAMKFFGSPLVSYLRKWDKIAVQRPDVCLATCENVKKRIKKYYDRDSEIVYPPVDTMKFNRKHLRGKTGLSPKRTPRRRNQEDYFLIVSRLVPYKRVDIAIEAFNQLGLPLKIIGVGNQMRKLKSKANRNIEFLGHLTDEQLLGYYKSCQAVIFPQEEDFGLVPLEAQACGRPVIAYRKGGALETVVDGKTGLFFYPQTAEALRKVIAHFDTSMYRSETCRQKAEKFSQERFKEKFKKIVKVKWKNFRN